MTKHVSGESPPPTLLVMVVGRVLQFLSRLCQVEVFGMSVAQVSTTTQAGGHSCADTSTQLAEPLAVASGY
ncbi:MAG: hypothetical protein ABR568_12675 [Pyrinomonadaceae bacterium]